MVAKYSIVFSFSPLYQSLRKHIIGKFLGDFSTFTFDSSAFALE
jgi:hypothetical protein